jgi:hypothetical protein
MNNATETTPNTRTLALEPKLKRPRFFGASGRGVSMARAPTRKGL